MPSLRAFSNRNVVLTILFNFIDGACFSVWSAQLLPVLVSKLGGDTAVGWCAAASGFAQIISSLIAGHTADRLPREEVIRVGAFCGFVAVAATLVAVNLVDMTALYVTQALWGVYIAFVSTSAEALFADSVASGHRAFIYTFKWIVQTVCYCVGYSVALVMLLLLGNEWSINSLKVVMTVGLAMHPLAHILLFWLRDQHALQQDDSLVHSTYEEEKEEEEEEKNKRDESIQLWGIEQRKKDKLASSIEDPLLTESSPLSDKRSDFGENKTANGVHYEERRSSIEDMVSRTNRSSSLWCHMSVLFSKDAIPYMVCFTDFWMAVGSGMSVQYLPIFFVNNYDIPPTWLMSAYIVISCGSALCATIVRYVGEHYIGRLPAVISVRLLGTACMLALGLVQGNMARMGVVLTFFIVRNACMNSTMGITRSVIMDCVKKGNRAKWSAFESVSSFTWAGSATIGGYIVREKGYQFVFFVTAILHFFGIAVLIPAAIAARSVEKRLHRAKYSQ